MRNGYYIVKGYRNDAGRKLMQFAGVDNNEEVYLEKTSYTDRCACCGKTTYWTMEGEYSTPVGTRCVENLILEKIK